MKTNIHPEYMESKVECACGNTFVTRATVPSIRIEICNQCHPFYTGTAKLIDTAGRVDKFRARIEKAKANPKPKKKARKQQSESSGSFEVGAEEESGKK